MGNYEKFIWEALLDADMNHRYFLEIHDRFRKWDKWSRIALALMTSGTVATWSLWKTDTGAVTWKLLSASAAIWSIVSPFFNWSKKAELASSLKIAYQAVTSDYDILWLQRASLDEKGALKKLEVIQHKKNELAKIEKELPTNDKKLILKCQDDVELARNLKR